eukprot:TRINITY_DN13062_c0_g1_i1.p1 TRINITY_DN13062_c0_g1~~TRINITY_DN13062_c0_g1_i1.p1  ORF type:complete len:117 (+),score=15.13 TRINITY_DN13062_c0_g1_i1:128-478(+)
MQLDMENEDVIDAMVEQSAFQPCFLAIALFFHHLLYIPSFFFFCTFTVLVPTCMLLASCLSASPLLIVECIIIGGLDSLLQVFWQNYLFNVLDQSPNSYRRCALFSPHLSAAGGLC